MTNDEGRLQRLRRRIRSLDAALLGLVAERLELAREVGEAKRGSGVPLRDFEVEKRVLARAADTAATLGVAPDLARGLMRLLIEEACRIQEVEQYSAYSGEAESILVLGGAGRMGRWLVRFLASQGHRVRVFDPAAVAGRGPAAAVDSLDAGLDGATLVFVATPLETVAESIDAVTGRGFGGVVCDVASLKAHLRPALERARVRGAGVTSIHPMFGPGARTLSDQVIVVCDCGDRRATDRVVALFCETAATLVELSLERHDEIASYVLGLSHLLNLVFARSLAESGLGHRELAAVGSTTFHAQLATTASVIAESPDLYFGIQKLNANTDRVHRRLAASLDDWTRWIAAGDLEAFSRAMRSALDWLRDEPAPGG
jgi:chorismate mutase / prephenate dehydrogenase